MTVANRWHKMSLHFRKTITLTLLMCCLFRPSSGEAAESFESTESIESKGLTQSIANVLKEIETIKPGMKRKDLLAIFSEEGGISNRIRRTYVYQRCPFIKVDVEFIPADQSENKLNENPEDVIKEISRPYLAWTIVD